MAVAVHAVYQDVALMLLISPIRSVKTILHMCADHAVLRDGAQQHGHRAKGAEQGGARLVVVVVVVRRQVGRIEEWLAGTWVAGKGVRSPSSAPQGGQPP